jgi:hypothetical protein
VTVGVGIVLAAFVVAALARNEARRRQVTTVRVDVGPDGARRWLSDGREESIRWDEVRVVEVMVAVRGPHRATGGVVVLSGDDEHGCLVPIDAVASSGLLERLATWPGLEVKVLADALSGDAPTLDGMGAIGRRRYVRVWERPPS